MQQISNMLLFLLLSLSLSVVAVVPVGSLSMLSCCPSISKQTPHLNHPNFPLDYTISVELGSFSRNLKCVKHDL